MYIDLIYMYFVKGDISINLSQQAQEVPLEKSVRKIIINKEKKIRNINEHKIITTTT